MSDRPILAIAPTDPLARCEEHLAAPPTARPAVDTDAFREALHGAAHSLAAGEAELDSAVGRLSSGRSLSPEELIALQATVYRYAAEVEMAAKLVDKLTGAVRTALTSQQ